VKEELAIDDEDDEMGMLTFANTEKSDEES
jgi:hypothetical protein